MQVIEYITLPSTADSAEPSQSSRPSNSVPPHPTSQISFHAVPPPPFVPHPPSFIPNPLSFVAYPPPAPPCPSFVLDPALAPPYPSFALDPALSPRQLSSVQMHPQVQSFPGQPQYPEPAVPHAGTIAMAPSSGPRRTRSQKTVRQGAQRVPRQTRPAKQKAKRAGGPKPIPHDEAGIYPVSTEECVGAGKAWACPFPDCEVAVKDSECAMGAHFTECHAGAGKVHQCTLLVKEKTGVQQIRSCAMSYKDERGLGRHVLNFHMGLGKKVCTRCGETLVRAMDRDGSGSSYMARHLKVCKGR
ncbi:hypothetical protein DENSPDRAFT_885778 [Dentipellis sp. KUC8613]|nr:hypothetical protein DENSPDRAFT_885778 [Dentipellis sp. KUC8613]